MHKPLAALKSCHRDMCIASLSHASVRMHAKLRWQSTCLLMWTGGCCRQPSVLMRCAGLTWSTLPALPALDWLGGAAWIMEGGDMALLRTKQCAHMKEPKSTVFPVQSERIHTHTTCPFRQCVFMRPMSPAPVNTVQKKTGPDRATPTSM